MTSRSPGEPMTSEAPQDVAALPQTEAGKRLVAAGIPVVPTRELAESWGRDVLAPEVIRIEREAAAALLDQNDRLRSALEWALRNNGGECPADYPAGYAKALRVLWGSGAEEAARNG